MSSISWTGGADQDRRDIAQVYEKYRAANETVDSKVLPEVFSGSSEARYFNLNGFTYNSRDHWTKLWRYYSKFINSGPGHGFDAHGEISGDLAVIWLHRRTAIIPLTTDSVSTNWPVAGKEYLSRATVAFVREPEGWRIVHVHFSNGKEGERPGGI